MLARVSGGLIDNAVRIYDALPDSRFSALGNTRTDKQAWTHRPCSRQTACILKAPHRRFLEALVQVGQHSGHAIERRVNIHGLQLDFERAVPVSLVTELVSLDACSSGSAKWAASTRTYLSALRWKVWPGTLAQSTVKESAMPATISPFRQHPPCLTHLLARCGRNSC